MELHPKQKEIASSDARFKVIRAGRRGGKTALEVETMIFKAVSKKDSNIFYLAPNQTQARSIIWGALRTRLGNIGKANEQRLEMSVPTQDGGQSLIKIAGWENRENFRGQSANHITVDEIDTMKDFFIGWQEIFTPALIDTEGTTDFIGTPQKENPNLRRLEKFAEGKLDWETFHFTSWDNPHLKRAELEKWREELDGNTYRQEIEAEYVDHLGALFNYAALVDMFSNTVTKSSEKYLIVDIADDGLDKTIFTFWEGLECYRVEKFERLNTEQIINQIREYAQTDRIPYSQIAVDAIGVGAGVASSSLLDGVVGYKSSLGAIKTDLDPVRLPNVHYTKDAPLISEYKNLRSQCIFELARHVNNHEIACKTEDVRIKEAIIEELGTYQDASKGDGKRFATPKEDVKELIGRSPDISDTFIMRMYFVIREQMTGHQSEDAIKLHNALQDQFARNEARYNTNNTR
jgi:hypothetical protein